MVQPKQPNGGLSVKVNRTKLPAPDLTDPDRKIIQVQYNVGDLPARFIYITEKEWSKEEEAKRIKADMDKRLTSPGENIII